MKYRNDEWVLTDEYGLGGAGDALAGIALEAQAPFTIAVTGKWGAGKTSVLRRAFATLGGKPVSQALPLGEEKQEGNQSDWDALKYSLKERQRKLRWDDSLTSTVKQSKCIWYSPWQHQNEANPIIPLLLELKQQFVPMDKIKSVNRQAGLAAVTLLERSIDAALSLSAGKNMKIATGTSEAARKAWQDGGAKLTQLSDGQRFHLLFEDAIEAILESAKTNKSNELTADARLIIFIDDLDRCEEQVVVSLLEAIKLYLGTQRCIFVLGMDDTALLGALGRVWKDRSEDDNREYLEKLLQTTLPVPLPRPAKINNAIAEQLAAHNFPAAKVCAEQIEALLEPNPRKIKNFINSLCSCWRMFQLDRGGESNQEVAIHFIMFHYLRLYHRPIWRLMERQPVAQRLLYAILKKNKISYNEPIDGIHDLEAQRMMSSFMQQAFAHVLKQQSDESGENTHHGEKLGEAIVRFQQRQDRKRSDEVFVTWFIQDEHNDAPLNTDYLYLPQIQTTDETS